MAHLSLKLTYFDAKGRAELCRMLLYYGGVEFADDRVAQTDFPTLKLTLPFGQLPVLEIDGNIYAQSMAIARFAAKLAGLYPSDPAKALKADILSCSLGDLESPFMDFMFLAQDETEKAKKKKLFIDKTVPKVFTQLEKLVEGDFSLATLSYADVQFFDYVENSLKWLFPEFTLEAFPKLAVLVKNVSTEPKIAAYHATSN